MSRVSRPSCTALEVYTWISESSARWHMSSLVILYTSHVLVSPPTHTHIQPNKQKACDAGGEWKTAVKLVEAMRQGGMHPDLYSFNTAISACQKVSSLSLCLSLYRMLVVIVLNSRFHLCPGPPPPPTKVPQRPIYFPYLYYKHRRLGRFGRSPASSPGWRKATPRSRPTPSPSSPPPPPACRLGRSTSCSRYDRLEGGLGNRVCVYIYSWVVEGLVYG